MAVDLEQKAEYLSLIDVLRELPKDEIARLAAELPMRAYSGGAVIYTPGDPPSMLFLLKRGSVKIVQEALGGKRLATAVLHPYTFFGEMALVGERVPRGSSAQAVGDVLVCLLDRAVLERLVLAYPHVGLRLLQRLSERLAAAEAALADFAYAPVTARLARVLVREARTGHASAPVVSASHDELAALVGTYRETITTVLRRLQRDGLVELGRRSVRLLDVEALERLTDHSPPSFSG
jgi:CRP/FNR family transcriptional regulator, cyclic AMP receptor protein